jgi:hypothetical protein
MSRDFTPFYSSTSDGSDLTLCRILEAAGSIQYKVTTGVPVTAGFVIPPYNDVELQYQNGAYPTKPTYITFKQNGTPVYYIYLEYDANGAVTRVAQD